MKKFLIFLIFANLISNIATAQGVETAFSNWDYTTSNSASISGLDCGKTITLTSDHQFSNNMHPICNSNGAVFSNTPNNTLITITFGSPVHNPALFVCDIDGNESLINISPTPASASPSFVLNDATISSGGQNNQSGWIYWTGEVSSITFNYSQSSFGTIQLGSLSFDCSVCCQGKGIKTYFASDFSLEPIIAPNSIEPGEYGASINGTEATTISPSWNVMDNALCTYDDGGFYVFNGATGGEPEAVIASITFDDNNLKGDFRFCFSAKNLDQCSFNVMPKIRIVYNGNEILPLTTIDSGSDPCEWTQLTTTFTFASATDPLVVYLDQSGVGDGNDIALDNFKVIQIEDCSGTAEFELNTTLTNNNTAFNINIEDVTTSSDCQYSTWSICKDNGNGGCVPGTSASGWWDGEDFPNFNGYQFDHYDSDFSDQAGIFELGYPFYLITRTLNGACNNSISITEPAGVLLKKLKNGKIVFVNQDGKVLTKNYKKGTVSSNLVNSRIQVFPNPSTGSIQIHVNNLENAQGDVKVYNSVGDVVWQQTISEQEATWDRKILLKKDGYYSIKILLGTKSITKDVIISNK